VALDSDFVLEALLRHNYLPMQKKESEELPPIFSSSTFTPNVARQLAAAKPDRQSKCAPCLGYDAVEYRLTRFNNVSRACAIPHPTAYALLCLCIHDNWSDLASIEQNPSSIIRPRRHRDGRLIVMDYERSMEKQRAALVSRTGQRYVVTTDISNFFPSVYTHSIPWAAVGFDTAKATRGTRSVWYNKLDTCAQQMKRGETQGIAIGPATSNILIELILAVIDKKLRSFCSSR